MAPADTSIRAFLGQVDRQVVRLGAREYLAAERLLRAAEAPWTHASLRAALASLVARDPEQWQRVARLYDEVWARKAEQPRVGRASVAQQDSSRPGTEATQVVLRPAERPKWPTRLRAWLRSMREAGVRRLRQAPRALWVAAIATLLAAGVGLLFARLTCCQQPAVGGEGGGGVVEKRVDPPTSSATTHTLVSVAPGEAEGSEAAGSEMGTTTERVLPPAESPGFLLILCATSMAIVLLGWHLVATPAAARAARDHQLEARRSRTTKLRHDLEAQKAAAGKPLTVRYQVALDLPGVSRQGVLDSAEHLGRLGHEERGADLDVDATLGRTVRSGGRFLPAYALRRVRHEVLVLVDVEKGCPPFLPGFRRLLTMWTSQGIHLRRYTFRFSPDTVEDAETGRALAVADLARQTEGLPLIVYGRSLDPGARTGTFAWPRHLAAWPRRAWLDPNPRSIEALPPARRQVAFALEQLGLRRYQLSDPGLVALARALASERVGSLDAVDLPVLPVRAPAGQGCAVAEALRLWALIGALVPDPTWDQLEAIRKHFPEIAGSLPHAQCLQLLIEWVEQELRATRHDQVHAERDGLRGGLRLPPELQDAWITAQRVLEADLPVKERIEARGRLLLLDQLASTRPDDPLDEYWWRFKRAMHEAVLSPERAEELLRDFYDSPVAQEAGAVIERELSSQVPGRGTHLGVNTADVLRGIAGRVNGVPLRSVVFPDPSSDWKRLNQVGVGVLLMLLPGLLLGLLTDVPWRSAFAYERPLVVETGPVWRLVENDDSMPTMIRIEGGTFLMGSETGDDNEKPVRAVTVASFEIAKTEVTVAQYNRCVDDGECNAVQVESADCNWKVPGRENHPMNCVSWGEARRYAEWMGGRLLSEAEWEYAARGGGLDREYSWGDEPADCSRAVIDAEGGEGCGEGGTWAVCSKPGGHTVQGLCDMAGNVREWVEDDWHGSYDEAADDAKPWFDPTLRGGFRVIRGGSWRIVPRSARVAFRFGTESSYRFDYLGFRVARSDGESRTVR